MKVKWSAPLSLTLGFVLTLASATGAQQHQGQAPKGEKELQGYALGYDLGSQLRRLSVEVDEAALARGLHDAMTGVETVMSPAEAKILIAQMQAELRTRQTQAPTAIDPTAAAANSKAGEAFLAENAKKPGVITLPSGLQYRVIQAGTGRKPTASDTVVCHYRGTLVDGTEFDSSYSRNQPGVFRVNEVMPGWTEALQLMSAGSKWQLFIPARLAYGERPVGPRIGPNATLVFEIELLSVR